MGMFLWEVLQPIHDFCTFQAWWNFYNCLSFIINKMRGNFTCCLVNVIDNGTQQLFVRYGVYFMELWKEKLKIIVQILCLNRLCEHGLTYAGLGNAMCRVPWWQLYHPECLSVSSYLMVRPNPSTYNSIVFFCVFFFSCRLTGCSRTASWRTSQHFCGLYVCMTPQEKLLYDSEN